MPLDWPSDTGTQIIVGVVASVVFLLLTYLCNLIWRGIYGRLILPRLYSDTADISGNWHTKWTDPSGHSCSETVNLTQRGQYLEGIQDYLITYKNSDRHLRKRLKFRGVIRHNILAGHYWNEERRSHGIGSFTLQLARDHRELRGQYSWYDVELERLDSGPYHWKRG